MPASTRSETSIAASGTSSAQARDAKYAPPNSAIASTGEKFGGCGRSRESAASRIITASTSGPGARMVSVAGRFICVGVRFGRNR